MSRGSQERRTSRVGSISSAQSRNQAGLPGWAMMRWYRRVKETPADAPNSRSSRSASDRDGVRVAFSNLLTCVCVHPSRDATAACDNSAASRSRRISAPNRTRGDSGSRDGTTCMTNPL